MDDQGTILAWLMIMLVALIAGVLGLVMFGDRLEEWVFEKLKRLDYFLFGNKED